MSGRNSRGAFRENLCALKSRIACSWHPRPLQVIWGRAWKARDASGRSITGGFAPRDRETQKLQSAQKPEKSPDSHRRHSTQYDAKIWQRIYPEIADKNIELRSFECW